MLFRSFSPKDLVNMVGFPKDQGNQQIRKLFENKKFKLMDNRIFVSDVEEIKKQAEFYWKMEKIERARRQSSMKL